MDLHQIQTVALTVTAVGGAAAMLYGFFKHALPHLCERWRNRRSAVMFRTVMSIDAGQRDAREERKQVAHQLSDLKKEFILFGATVRAVIASDTALATFEATADGLLKDSSRNFLLWTGKTQVEVERWGWLNSVAPEHRQTVRAEWESAVKDVRQVTLQFDMLDPEGNAFPVKATVSPIPEGINPCDKFVVVLHKL